MQDDRASELRHGGPPATSNDTEQASPAEETPGLTDPGFLFVLATAILLLGVSWWQIHGYQLADSVEYMERAQGIARQTELIDSQAIRGFGFSGILTPLFLAGDLLGLEDFRPVVRSARLLQIVLGLCLVVLTVRIGARVAGRGAGLAAGLAISSNAVFLRWSVSPTADIAASCCVGLAVLALMEREHRRRAFVGGLFLGASFLMSYKTLVLIAPILLWVTVRDFRASRAHIVAVIAGVLLAALLQCFLDLLYYGSFGVSLAHYLRENLALVVASMFHRLGFDGISEPIYNWAFETTATIDTAYQGQVNVIHTRFPPRWYLQNFTRIVPWPGIALLVLGVLSALRRARGGVGLVLLLAASYVFVLSYKGSKEFRLLVPILPFLGILVAQGFGALAGRRAHAGGEEGGCLRRTLAIGLLLASCALGVRQLSVTNRHLFGAYWDGMEIVNDFASASYAERAARSLEAGLEEPPKVRVACAYHWAVYMQESALVELVKLPHHLDHWNRYTAEEKQRDLESIASMDWFITHLPILTEHPELMDAVNRDFSINTVLYDRRTFEFLGPIYVLQKRTGEPEPRTFYDLSEEVDVDTYCAQHGLDRRLSFSDPAAPPGSAAPLTLLGWSYEPLPRVPGTPSSGHGWITYHWLGGEFTGVDYHLRDRITSYDSRNAWQNNHQPAYGMLPTSEWEAGRILREGYLVVAEAEAFDPEAPTRPVGGAYRRGHLIPVFLWFDVVAYGEVEPGSSPSIVGRLVPTTGARPVAELAPPGEFLTPEGLRTSKDGMTLVDRFFLPVRDEYKLADDGKPVPIDG